METLEKLIRMAEDELTQYSIEARKIERLRPKVGLAVPYPQQTQLRETLEAEMPKHIVARIVESQRQLCALPFWGIGGLGLLIGISTQHPLDLIATGIGFYVAFAIQKWGWNLEARRLLMKTLDEIEASLAADRLNPETTE
jgi:hypothetical protein